MLYEDFALFYDRLTENIDYESLADTYAGLLRNFGRESGELLDIACGTGNLSIPLQKPGFNVTAADISEEMLAVASAKGSDVRFLRCDMTKLPFERQFDFAVCALDSINHLSSLQAIQSAFDGVYRSLKEGGVFAADLNAPYKHREVLANNAFTFDYDGLFCAWQNELDESDPLLRVDMFLDFFKENEDGSYTRYTDSLSEIAPDIETVRQMLEKSGFCDIEICDYPSGGKFTDKSEKYFICGRKG